MHYQLKRSGTQANPRPGTSTTSFARPPSNSLAFTGPSTGTNIWGTLQVAREMQAAGRTGSVVTLMCDSGQRYLDTYYNPDWVRDRIGDIAPDAATLARFSG